MTDYSKDIQTLQHMRALAPPKGPTRASHVTALVTLLPLGGTLLGFSGATLACTGVGLAIVTPLFILFSPVVVPAALTIGLAVAGFLVSGALGLAALSVFAWIFSYFRGRRGAAPGLSVEPLERARKHAPGVGVGVAGYGY